MYFVCIYTYVQRTCSPKLCLWQVWNLRLPRLKLTVLQKIVLGPLKSILGAMAIVKMEQKSVQLTLHTFADFRACLKSPKHQRICTKLVRTLSRILNLCPRNVVFTPVT